MKPAPSYKNTPSSLNPDAYSVWRYTVKHYADSIYESKDLTTQWTVAKNNFERLCRIRNIAPYANKLEALANRLAQLAENI